MFKKVDSSVDFPKLEKEIIKFWNRETIFEKSIEKTKGNKKFIFYEGPPTANGAPGVHHVLSRVFKDIFPRYKTMKGFHVPRKAGWDTHGLPVELEIEKKLNINSKIEIEKVGIKEFNRLCKESVMKYEADWKKMTERIGFWIDMDHAYFTFKNEYIETVWWILKTIWDRGLLYEGHKIVPYCPRCGTALSSHEVAQGYKEIEDYSVIVKFKLKDEDHTYLLVWTTTPWTLISNVAAAVDKKSDYIKARIGDDFYIINENLAREVFADQEYVIIEKIKGQQLLHRSYAPLYDYAGSDSKAYKILEGDFVSTQEGTGIVHIAPAFGEDDMQVGIKNNLPIVQMVDGEGRFKKEVDKFADLEIDEANPKILADLKQRGLLFVQKKLTHSYPFCWRCEKRLIYFAKKSWYIRTTEIKEDLLASNEDVNWYPGHIKHGRYGKWLENNIDWALTRERYWGTPLPVWVDDNGHKICIGSIEELRQKAQSLPENIDLHRPYVDDIEILCEQCGEKMKRVSEVIDVWFDSGSMPYAQFHYPFENKELFEESFPADFICEAIDQTRGWFYTMMSISTMLFKKSSYKNVLCLGLINDELGQKMSKSKGNIIKPDDILETQGADALRWYLFTAVSPWLPKNFSIKGVEEVVRKFLLTLWNTYSFFVIYANIDNFNPLDHELQVEDRFEIDRWILSEMHKTIKKVNEYMDDFNVTDSGRLIQQFVDNLSNWYVRRSRRRFWKSEEDKDKISAYMTLYDCLLTLSKLAAPYIPFICESIYQNLSKGLSEPRQSVHLEEYPQAMEPYIDERLNFNMEVARKAVGLGRAIRSKTNIRIRQPLSTAKIYVLNEDVKKAILYFKDIIIEELNIKEIEFSENIEEIVSFEIKPNLRLLGAKYKGVLPRIKQALAEKDPVEVAIGVQENKSVMLEIDKEEILILPEEILVEIATKGSISSESDGEVTMGLVTELSDELKQEGFCRELVHHIQNMRKEAGFEIENTIKASISCDRKLADVINHYMDYIKRETLSESLEFQSGQNTFSKKISIEGNALDIGVSVTGSIG